MEIRKLSAIDELHEVATLEGNIWGSSPIPVHQTYTAIDNGGMMLGAFVDGKMVGYLYSFAAFDGKDVYLCSHQMGFLPEYRTGGYGEQLKKHQFQLAKDMGYQYIRWTFDPLESVNAYLNLHKLKARGVYYRENYYGMLKDGLNEGMPTDRIVIHWYVQHPMERKNISFDDSKVLLKVGENGKPVPFPHENFQKKQGPWFIEIPEEIQKLKIENKEIAKQWRLETRNLFQLLFTQGFNAVDTIRNNGTYYVFSK